MQETMGKASERGFILATSLVLLVLLTMLSIATYYGTIISQRTSEAAQGSTEAFYYAETGLSYVAWALKNDAELDGYDPLPRLDPYGFTMDSYVSGDRREWGANKGNPSNLQYISKAFKNPVAPLKVYGQLGYFDNRSFDQRPVGLIQITEPTTGVTDVYTMVKGKYYKNVSGKKKIVSPVFHDIYTQLSGYIRLDIDAYGNITPSFSPYVQGALVQHGGNAHTCNGQTVGDVPCNGAIVWLTAGGKYTDRVLYPIDPYVAAPLQDYYVEGVNTNSRLFTGLDVYGFPLLSVGQVLPATGGVTLTSAPLVTFDVYGEKITYNAPPLPRVTIGRAAKKMPQSFPSYYSTLPCDLSLYSSDSNHIACEQWVDPYTGVSVLGKGAWLGEVGYNLVVYAIGYSGGQARKMVRMIIQM